jgi:hypothetical protein
MGVRGYTEKSTFTLSIKPTDLSTPTSQEPAASTSMDTSADTSTTSSTKPCSNCHQSIPLQTYAMHEAFCLRNNAICQKCKDLSLTPYVFKKTALENASHWHCSDCWTICNSPTSKQKHEYFMHTLKLPCPLSTSCPAKSMPLPEISQHVTKSCAFRLIVCRYCHLRVMAGPPSTLPKDRLLDLDLCEHESTCGSRTITCQKCSAHVQLKDVAVHAKVPCPSSSPLLSQALPSLGPCRFCLDPRTC